MGSDFIAVDVGGTDGSGTVVSGAGTGALVRIDEDVVTLDLLSTDLASDVAIKAAAGLTTYAATTNALIDSAIVDPRISNVVVVTFSPSAGVGVISNTTAAAYTATDGEIRQSFDNATLTATDNGVSRLVNGVPNIGFSLNYIDTDPFLDRLEMRWFPSSDTNISLDPTDTSLAAEDAPAYIGLDPALAREIGNSLTTNSSPFEIYGLEPATDYQVEVRALSFLGSKGVGGYTVNDNGLTATVNPSLTDDLFLRLPTVTTDSLASLYDASLIPSTIVVSSVGSFSETGEYQLFSGNNRLLDAGDNVYYSVDTSAGVLVNIPEASIDDNLIRELLL